MLAQPSVVLVVYALVHGVRYPVLAHLPACAAHPELLEVGLQQDSDGCWRLLELEAASVEIEVVCGD
jgi:hypothetical protein